MNNPFLYPKYRHTRSLSPPSYSRYQRYKPFLKKEFERKCVYCRTPDTWAPDHFGVDHYRPKSQFPELVNAYPNLYYCCNPCNSRKGDHWPSGKKAQDMIIPNPCDHSMAQHLRYKHPLVEAKTKSGEFTRGLLDLNAPDIVRRRTLLLDVVQSCYANRTKLVEIREVTIKGLRSGKISKSTVGADLANIDADIRKMDDTISELSAAV